jgi:hypothetical protein
VIPPPNEAQLQYLNRETRQDGGGRDGLPRMRLHQRLKRAHFRNPSAKYSTLKGYEPGEKLQAPWSAGSTASNGN